jgi:hypothetical protein
VRNLTRTTAGIDQEWLALAGPEGLSGSRARRGKRAATSAYAQADADPRNGPWGESMAMHRTLAIAALCVATAATSTNAATVDTRCSALDAVAVGYLQRVLEHSDARSTLTANTAMANLSWARLDCREGRVDRSLAAYQQVIEVLAEQEAASVRSEPAVRQSLRDHP